MLAKVIAYGHDRDEACARVARALTETRLHGVATNRDLLIGILRHPEFRSGATDTGFFDRHDPSALLAATAGADNSAVHAVVAALAAQAERRAATRSARAAVGLAQPAQRRSAGELHRGRAHPRGGLPVHHGAVADRWPDDFAVKLIPRRLASSTPRSTEFGGATG